MFETNTSVSLSDTVPDVAAVHRSEFVLRHPVLDKPLKLTHLQVFLGGFEKTQHLFFKTAQSHHYISLANINYMQLGNILPQLMPLGAIWLSKKLPTYNLSGWINFTVKVMG